MSVASLNAALEALRRLESPYVGIVGSKWEYLAQPNDCRLPRYQCELCDTKPLLGGTIPRRSTGGQNAEPDRAEAAALGEAAERYSAFFVPVERVTVGTAREIGETATGPNHFRRFTAEQLASPGFPFEPFTEDTPTQWIDGFRVADRREVLLPLQYTLLGHPFVSGGYPRIGDATSNGMASSTNLESALLGGLLELIERDAVMLTWLSRVSPQTIDLNSDAELAAFSATYFDPSGLRYSALDVSAYHGIPTVIGIVRPPEGVRGVVTIGAAAAFSSLEACVKAVGEAFYVRASAFFGLSQSDRKGLAGDGSNVTTLDDHLLFYADGSNQRALGFLLERTSSVVFSSLPQGATQSVEGRLAAVLDCLASRGLEAFAVDITSPDVRDLGLVVVKTFISDICELDVLHTSRYLANPRVLNAVFDCGYRQSPLKVHEINPMPHPFA